MTLGHGVLSTFGPLSKKHDFKTLDNQELGYFLNISSILININQPSKVKNFKHEKNYPGPCLLLGLFNTGRTQVIITEIMYNPPEGGNDSLEYIELHNFHNFPTDISGWTFFPMNSIEYTFPLGTIMPPGGYLIVAKSASAFESVFGFTPTVWTAGALSNSGEVIELCRWCGYR